MTNEKNEQTNEQVEQPNKEAFKEYLLKQQQDLPQSNFDEDDTPNFKFEDENKIYEITILPEEFGEWIDNESGVKKKIIKVEVEKVTYKWWLNVKNPVFGEIIKGSLEGQMTFKVMRQGDKKNTKYIVVKD